MRPLSWQHTAIIVAFLAAIVALAWSGHDTAALIAVGTALLAGLGLSLGQTQTVKEHVNGNTTRLLQIVEAQGKMLASMQPASATVVEGEVVDEPTQPIPPV